MGTGILLSPNAVDIELREFLDQPVRSNLVLPQFHGGATSESVAPLFYRGSTFSERDSKAAFYVHALLLRTISADEIRITPPDSYREPIQSQDVSFLFGSRSNPVTQLVLAGVDHAKVSLEFGDEWQIHCAGQTFSIPDPSRTEPRIYEASDDYGVIAKIRSDANGSSFVLAGLGGRATEGSARYFCDYWKLLHQEFGQQNFAVVLKFAAPFSFDRIERVASSRWAVDFRVQ